MESKDIDDDHAPGFELDVEFLDIPNFTIRRRREATGFESCICQDMFCETCDWGKEPERLVENC